MLDTRRGGTLDNARRIPLGQRLAWARYLTPDTGVGAMVGPDGTIQTGRGLVEVDIPLDLRNAPPRPGHQRCSRSGMGRLRLEPRGG